MLRSKNIYIYIYIFLLRDRISDIINLATKTLLNTKINEVKAKIPSIYGLDTTTAVTALENKISGVNNLVKKTGYDTKVNKIINKITDHSLDKCVTTPKFNKLTA